VGGRGTVYRYGLVNGHRVAYGGAEGGVRADGKEEDDFTSLKATTLFQTRETKYWFQLLLFFFRPRNSSCQSNTNYPLTSSDQRRTSDRTDYIPLRGNLAGRPVPPPSARPTSNSTTSTALERTRVQQHHRSDQYSHSLINTRIV